MKLDPTTGALAMDSAFHDGEGKPGFNFANRDWPQGWKGSGKPYGVVFSAKAEVTTYSSNAWRRSALSPAGETKSEGSCFPGIQNRDLRIGEVAHVA